MSEGMMKLRSASLVVVAIALLITSCGNDQKETVSFLDGQFVALKPATWSLMSNLNEEADLQMGNASKKAYGVVLSEAKVDFAGEMTLSKFSDVTRAPLKNSLQNYSEEGPENLVLNGRPAIRYTLGGSLGSIRIKYWHTSIDSPTHYHQVLLWSLPSKFDDNKADFESVLNSIRKTGDT